MNTSLEGLYSPGTPKRVLVFLYDPVKILFYLSVFTIIQNNIIVLFQRPKLYTDHTVV